MPDTQFATNMLLKVSPTCIFQNSCLTFYDACSFSWFQYVSIVMSEVTGRLKGAIIKVYNLVLSLVAVTKW